MDTSQENVLSSKTASDDRDNSAVLIGMVAVALSGAVVGFCFGGYFALAFCVPGLFAAGCLAGWKANTVCRPGNHPNFDGF
ncbi:MAG: hypothetical protein ABJ360_01040 [Roseobacter sp.]|uniref:hypothetical protein n=1 Tax=Alphaproteobacteria TaxID=28211 RepID=UPI003263937F